MLIRSIGAKNFKSLTDFELDLAKFTVLIGLNGAGKSSVLQFIDFIAQLVRGNLKGWLEERHWRPKELVSQFTTRKNIEFHVELGSGTDDRGISWKGNFNTTQLHCNSERIETPEAALEVKDGHLWIYSSSK
jgi:predicted ATPase